MNEWQEVVESHKSAISWFEFCLCSESIGMTLDNCFPSDPPHPIALWDNTGLPFSVVVTKTITYVKCFERENNSTNAKYYFFKAL